MKGKTSRAVAVVPAAGTGRRMGTREKVFISLAGMPVLARTLSILERCSSVEAVVVAVPEEKIERCREEIVGRFGLGKVKEVVSGGRTRQDSVRKALGAAGEGFDIAIVHDGARPLVAVEIIENCIREAGASGAAVTVVPVKDTIKEVKGGIIEGTVDRRRLRAAQTPQAFSFTLLVEAMEKAHREGFVGTDESSLVERLGVRVRAVEGSYENIKITTPEDLVVAEAILGKRAEE